MLLNMYFQQKGEMMKGNITVKNGRWYAIINYKDEYGQPKVKWVATGLTEKGNKRKAEEALKQALEDYENNLTYEKSDDSKMLFADYMNKWLEMAKPNLQLSSYGAYQKQVKQIAEYFQPKQIRLLDLKPMDIAGYYSHMLENGKTIQACEHHHVNIRKALQVAYRADLIPTNPADKVDRPKSPKHTAKYYDSEQLKSCLRQPRVTGLIIFTK